MPKTAQAQLQYRLETGHIEDDVEIDRAMNKQVDRTTKRLSDGQRRARREKLAEGQVAIESMVKNLREIEAKMHPIQAAAVEAANVQ